MSQKPMSDSNPVVIANDQSVVPVGGNVASAATDSGNPVKIAGVFLTDGISPALTTGQRGDIQLDNNGRILARLVGTAAASSDGLASTIAYMVDTASANLRPLAIAPHIFNGTTWDRLVSPNATSRIVSAAASTNATSAKASAGRVFTITGRNAAAAVRYLKLYNKASAPTVGTDTPTHTFALGNAADFRFCLEGRYFSTGIAYALTTGSADSDTGALTAADVLGLNIDYA